MAKKIVFSKAYTRDFSLIIEEAWSHGLTEGMASAFGWKGLDGTPCVYFLHNGAIEVWDNLAYIKKVKNRILQQNKKNSAWLGRTIATYNTYLGSILRMAKKAPLKNSTELKKFIQLVFDSMAWFLPFYYASHDSRTPKKLMEIAKKTRLVDVSFDLMDSVIRKSIIAQYPSLKGIENTLIRKDLLQREQHRAELKERFSQFVMVPPDVYQSVSLHAYEKLHREKEFLF